MSEAVGGPRYVGAIFDISNVELGPIPLVDAADDEEAIKFAIQRARAWLAANRAINGAILQIAKDGATFRRISVEWSS
jgi:hypothetical protein